MTECIDKRGFFCVPAATEGDAYYRYGTPGNGFGQFAHPAMLSFIFHLAFKWSGQDRRRVGIGNVSLRDGAVFPPHRTHRSGLEVDIRPIRKDGKEMPVNIHSKEYDRKATYDLVDAIWSTGLVTKVGFNDRSIPRTTIVPGHDDHLHVVLKA